MAVKLHALLAILSILVVLLAGLWSPGPGGAQAQSGCSTFTATLTGAQQVPPVASSGTGTGSVVLNAAQTQITVNLTFAGLTTPANVAHIHGPGAPGVNAPILFPFSGVPAAPSGSIPQQSFAITAAQVADLQAGLYYMNVHSTMFPNGEIRGQLQCASACVASLSGDQQVPPVVSSGTGAGSVVLNAAQTQITVNLTFAGLTTTAIAAHIHGPGAPGVNAPILFPFSGVQAATDGSIPQQSFAITPSQRVADLQAGLYYMNVHSTMFPNGEIRGQLQCPAAPAATPTPTATVTVTATPTATPTPCILGDINCDGIVDIRDYGIWRQNFGQTNCGNPADLDGNCIVDIRDYGIWRANFGHTAGAAARGALPGAPPTSTATPMPRAGSPPASPWGGSPWGVFRQAVQDLSSILPPALLLQGIP
jgi:hypothetical protein